MLIEPPPARRHAGTSMATRKRPGSLTKVLYVLIAVYGSLAAFLFRSFYLSNEGSKVEEEKFGHGEEPKEDRESTVESSSSTSPPLGRLRCEIYGGPSDKAAQEMVYWRDIPQDDAHKNVFRSAKQRKFVSMEADAGGFNNVRMSVECGMALAYATGRTFVLPPRQGVYLLEDGVSWRDFYDLEGLDVIETKEFLEEQVMGTGNIRDRTTGSHVVPPLNRTDWTNLKERDVQTPDEDRQLDFFFRTIGISPKFLPGEKIVFVPTKPFVNKEEWRSTESALMKEFKEGSSENHHATPVNASAAERLTEVFRGQDLWPYDNTIHDAPLVHLMADDEKMIRIMTHFYYFLFFEDWKADLRIKRYVRDKLRYKDELFCAAARVVERVRQESHRQGNNGVFYTYHVRRNDFVWIDLLKNASQLLKATNDLVPVNATVFIATDEHSKAWFAPMRDWFSGVHFIDDFTDVLQGIPSGYYGVLDELVAARGEKFMGVYHSTFTGHIAHMRGYYSQAEKKDHGWELGLTESYFYVPEEFKWFFRSFQPVGQHDVVDAAFPMAWRDIDQGI